MFLEFYRRVFRGLLVRRRAMVWPKGLIVLFCLIALAFLGVVDGRKKKGGKSKYQQALKCSSCIGAANEMREQIKVDSIIPLNTKLALIVLNLNAHAAAILPCHQTSLNYSSHPPFLPDHFLHPPDRMEGQGCHNPC